MSCDALPSWPEKTLVPGRVVALELDRAEFPVWGSSRKVVVVFSPAAELAVEGDRGSSAVRDVVAVDEMLLASDGRRCELDDDSDGGWNRMVSKPGFFFFLPSQLSRML